jgi:hypothetical protein
LNNTRPSIDSHLPSRVCTLFATAMGVQIRVAGTAVAVGERGGDEATHVDLPDPLGPGPGNRACGSMKLSASCTAAWWARSIAAATAGSATAHNADTDFTGENVKSKPATVCVRGRESLAICPANSRALTGFRPCSARKNSKAT